MKLKKVDSEATTEKSPEEEITESSRSCSGSVLLLKGPCGEIVQSTKCETVCGVIQEERRQIFHNESKEMNMR